MECAVFYQTNAVVCQRKNGTVYHTLSRNFSPCMQSGKLLSVICCKITAERRNSEVKYKRENLRDTLLLREFLAFTVYLSEMSNRYTHKIHFVCSYCSVGAIAERILKQLTKLPFYMK